MLMYWNDDVAGALGEVKKATSIAAESLPQLEPELSLLSADLLLRLDRNPEAITTIICRP